MTILIADLLTRLQADAPAQSGVPTTAQYTQAIKDAVADLSRQASVPRVAVFSIVAGTAAYDLPSDFQELIRLAAIGQPYPSVGSLGQPYAGWAGGGQVLITSAGLVPFTDAYRETVTIVGGQLVITPTPTVSAQRQLLYAAGDALNDAGTGYATLTADRASIALIYARALCLGMIASSGHADAVRLEMGVEMAGKDVIDTTKRGDALRSQIAALRQEYQDAVRVLIGTPGGLRI